MIRTQKRKSKIVSHIERTYKVYDEEDNLVDSFSDVSELIKKYDIKRTEIMYKSARENSYFAPNKNTMRKIRLEIERKKIIEEISLIKPFLLKEYEIQNIPAIDGEEWKQINGFGGYYYCSNKGRFKCVDIEGNEKLLNIVPSLNKTKRTYTDISLNPVNEDGSFDKALRFRTSRVLAQTWLDPTLKLDWKQDKREVDHIDNNSRNECIENLRVCTHTENIHYAKYEQGRQVGKEMKECYALNIFTDEIKKYSSTAKLVEDIFGKNNNGYFNSYNKNQSLARGKYLIGYDVKELKKIAEEKRNGRTNNN